MAQQKSEQVFTMQPAAGLWWSGVTVRSNKQQQQEPAVSTCGLMLALPILPVPLELGVEKSEFSRAEVGKLMRFFHPVSLPLCHRGGRMSVNIQVGIWLIVRE